MSPRRRWTLITAAAVATAILALTAPEAEEPAEPAARPRPIEALPTATPGQAPLVNVVDLPPRPPLGRQRADMFATRSWAPPPKPAAAAAEPPQPPPNPYRFAGMTEQEGVRKVFLALGDRIVEVKEGEKLEQGFRVQSVTAQAVMLVYEPLGTPTPLALTAPDGQAAAGASAPVPSPAR